METHSVILAWEISWTEDPGRPQSIGSQRVQYERSDLTQALFCCSVAKSRPILFDSMDCRTQGFPVLYYLKKLVRLTNSSSTNPFIFCLQSFPASRSFPMSLTLCNRWPKYQSYTFSISPSSEQLELIPFRIDCFDFHAAQVTLKRLLQYHNQKA